VSRNRVEKLKAGFHGHGPARVLLGAVELDDAGNRRRQVDCGASTGLCYCCPVSTARSCKPPHQHAGPAKDPDSSFYGLLRFSRRKFTGFGTIEQAKECGLPDDRQIARRARVRDCAATEAHTGLQFE
jgi:hypothetical protein